MAQPYVGEIRMFAGNYNPSGWAFCDGRLLSISDDETLYQLIGTTYGGDGLDTFAVPDLRGRLPLHQGNGFPLGGTGGVEEVTLNVTQIPRHAHGFGASTSPGSQARPQGGVLAYAPGVAPYVVDVPTTPLDAGAVEPTGLGQPHPNLQPYLSVHFIIARFGIYPSPT
jgi:microcystin-dependent protein